jgi:transcriptional regulator with XRE-family HTH domain
MDAKVLLGRRIKDLRKQRSLTQEKLAELAGVDVKYLGGIERGTENPSLGTLDKLAGALSVKIHQLLNFEHALQGERLLRRRILQAIDKCDERNLQIILRIINAINE